MIFVALMSALVLAICAPLVFILEGDAQGTAAMLALASGVVLVGFVLLPRDQA